VIIYCDGNSKRYGYMIKDGKHKVFEHEQPVKQAEYKAIIKQEGDWWIGWIEEVPGVNCQEPTHDELISSLQITLKEALEFNRASAYGNQ
jgi:hypothetical protein